MRHIFNICSSIVPKNPRALILLRNIHDSNNNRYTVILGIRHIHGEFLYDYHFASAQMNYNLSRLEVLL